jgi:uncharacterized protein YggE
VAVAAATAGLLFSGLAGASAASPRQPQQGAATTSSPPTITVTGTGIVNGTPDTLTLEMGVSATAATAVAALDQSSTELSALEKAFTSAGVASSDMQTSGLNLQPNYNSRGTVITSYTAADDLTITLSNLSAAGTVIDAAAHAVGNDVRIEGLSFSISKTAPLLARARAMAVRAAATSARQLATAAGTTLGPIVSLTDESEQLPSPSGPSGYAAEPVAAKSVPVPLQSGSEPVTVEVQVVYQLAS